MFKRILCALLAGAVLLPLASCSDKPADETQSAVTPDAESAAATEETQKYLDDVPETLTFSGQDIRFLVGDDSQELSALSIYVEEDTGDIVESSIFARNTIVEERLGIKINLVGAPFRDEIPSLIRSSVNANLDDYDIVGMHQYYQAGMAAEGLFYNLNKLPYNDFSREYWGTQYIDNMSYKDLTFWATGDLSLRYTGGLYVTYVNDRIWNENFAGQNIYNLVDEGTWTLDKLYELSSQVYVDADGNSKADAQDTYGFALSLEDPIDGIAAGAMVEFGRVDESGTPYISLDNERTYEFYDKLYNLIYNNPGFYQCAADDNNTAMTMFNEGHFLFHMNKLFQSALYLREMPDDFKIIPLPKNDEAQQQYNTRIHDSVNLYGMPITAVGQADAVSATLEAMASESYRVVSPAYFEKALKVKFTRDSDSGRMIDLISQNVSCDFVTLYSHSIGDINHFFRIQLMGKTDALASQFKKNKRLWEKSLEKLLKSFDATVDLSANAPADDAAAQ